MRFRCAWLVVALSGFSMVLAGAFGAHWLDGRVPQRLLEVFETAVRYQAWHTLAMLGVLVWRQVMPSKGQAMVLWLWGFGVVLFSGSLYLITLSGISTLGLITPIGGLLLMAGWLTLAVSAYRAQSPSGNA